MLGTADVLGTGDLLSTADVLVLGTADALVLGTADVERRGQSAHRLLYYSQAKKTARWQPGHSRWRKPRRGHSAGRPISRAPFWPLPSAWGQSLAAARWLARWHLAQPVSQSSQAARHPTWSTSRGASGKGVLNARSSGTLP